MERLISTSNNALNRAPVEFERYLLKEINWDHQLIGISGARGSGKTIMLLQYKKMLPKESFSLYASLDDVYFSENKLIYFAEEFHRKGGKYLLLDEVHKYPNWSQEIKNIYDNLPDLKVVFTSSSALEIYKGSHDLSRRAVVYHLVGLSFREFLEFKYKIKLPALKLDEILNNHTQISTDIVKEFKPLPYFAEYLKTGYYPFFKKFGADYPRQLINTVNLALEVDLPAIHRIDFNSIIKIKKLLYILSKNTPYTPNVEELAKQVGTTRDSLLKFLYFLDKAQIIKWLGRDKFGINYLNKPDKLYLNNTNIAYALGEPVTDIGTIRETFFLNQLSANHTVTYPHKTDFMVDDTWYFEIGGKSKSRKQLTDLENAWVAKDDIEYGFENSIPLWMFGLIY
jgi:predicted AAA+ superfamily ATPase